MRIAWSVLTSGQVKAEFSQGLPIVAIVEKCVLDA